MRGMEHIRSLSEILKVGWYVRGGWGRVRGKVREYHQHSSRAPNYMTPN